jgi:hypothetical protein
MLSSFWQWLQEAPSVFWQWLHETTPGQATFLGSVFGFLALLCGAWANASFNRRRDDRLRRLDQRAMAVALKTELAEWIGSDIPERALFHHTHLRGFSCPYDAPVA